MTGKRYAEIISHLHFIDNTAYHTAVKADPSLKDPLYKVRPLLTSLNTLLPQYFDCGAYIAGDESRICMTSRYAHFLMRYNPKKPIRHAANIYILCDSLTGAPLQVFMAVCVGFWGDGGSSFFRLTHACGFCSSSSRLLVGPPLDRS